MSRRLTAWVVVAMTSLALPAAALADPAETTRVPLAFTTWSRCPDGGDGEQVAFEGFMQVSSVFSSNAAGGFREHSLATVHLTGVGLTTGDKYVSSGVDSIGETTPAGGRSVVTEISHVKVVHTGEAPDDDFSLRMVLNSGGLSVELEGCH